MFFCASGPYRMILCLSRWLSNRFISFVFACPLYGLSRGVCRFHDCILLVNSVFKNCMVLIRFCVFLCTIAPRTLVGQKLCVAINGPIIGDSFCALKYLFIQYISDKNQNLAFAKLYARMQISGYCLQLGSLSQILMTSSRKLLLSQVKFVLQFTISTRSLSFLLSRERIVSLVIVQRKSN